MKGGVLILRPEPGNSATCAAATALGLSPLPFPLFSVEPAAWHPPEGPFDAVLMTSANAARHGGSDLARYHHLPVFAVGTASARAARAAGFTRVVKGGGTAAGTAPLMARSGARHVLHLCGSHRRAFDPGPVTIHAVPVYAVHPAGDAAGLMGQIDHLGQCGVLLVHSPRAGERLNMLVPAERRLGLSVAAISDAAAEASGEGWRHLAIATAPTDKAVLALAAKLCNV